MSSLALALVFAAVLTADKGNESFLIESKILGETRRVFVHPPQSFTKSSPSRRYPTVIAFDGQFVFKPVITTSEVLVAAGQMPESVIVAIENLDDYRLRVRDLTPPGLSVSGSGRAEGGDRFLDFIEKELLPALDAKFRTSAPRTLIGTSSGGILVTYAAATRETFRFALALDAPTHLDDGWLVQKLVARARAKNAAPVRYVTMDVRFGWSDADWKSLTAAAPPSWLLHREKLTRESHTSLGGPPASRRLARKRLAFGGGTPPGQPPGRRRSTIAASETCRDGAAVLRAASAIPRTGPRSDSG